MDKFKENQIAFVYCLLFLFFIPTAYAQNGGNGTAKEDGSDVGKVGVVEISLGRDDGAGRFGQETISFFPSDIPIHCSILLNSLEAAEVRMNLVAVTTDGYKPGDKVVVISYKTNGKQNRVNFTASPPETWPIGKYRVDIYIDGKLSGGREFEVVEDSKQ